MAAPLVSIVVPTIGRPSALARCLDSIEATVGVPHETICVTVEGDRESARVLAGRSVRPVVEPERGGFVRAANRGMRAATGTWVTQLNDDCALLPFTIENAIRFMEAPAHAGIGQAAFFHDSPLRRNVHAEIHVEGVRYVVAHVRGLCYANFGLARRALVERLGWYDEQYFMYGADPDLSLKVWHEAGLAVAPCPGALVHHEELDDERGAAERAMQAEDNRRLFAKWNLGDAAPAVAAAAPAR